MLWIVSSNKQRGRPISSEVRASVLCAESHGFEPRIGHAFFFAIALLGCSSCKTRTVGMLGSWCSGITSASHAEGPGFKSQWVHFFLRSSFHGVTFHSHESVLDATVWPSGLRRQTQVLVEQSAWVRTPQLTFRACGYVRSGLEK